MRDCILIKEKGCTHLMTPATKSGDFVSPNVF